MTSYFQTWVLIIYLLAKSGNFTLLVTFLLSLEKGKTVIFLAKKKKIIRMEIRFTNLCEIMLGGNTKVQTRT